MIICSQTVNTFIMHLCTLTRLILDILRVAENEHCNYSMIRLHVYILHVDFTIHDTRQLHWCQPRSNLVKTSTIKNIFIILLLGFWGGSDK